MKKNIAAQSNNTTTIDVTGLASGSETSHNCNKYLITKYDDKQHWQQCSICGKVIGNKSNHSFKTYYTMGDSCHIDNRKVQSCDCGYSITSKSGIRHKGTIWMNANLAIHVKYCSYCVASIGEPAEPHRNASGQILGCTTGISGTCAICGINISTPTHQVGPTYIYNSKQGYWSNNENQCISCKKELFDLTKSSINIQYTGSHNFTIKAKLYPKNNRTINCNNAAGFQNSAIGTATCVSSNIVNDHVEVVVNGTFKTITPSSPLGICEITGVSNDGRYYSVPVWVNLPSDNIVPSISNITQQDLTTKNGWATSKLVTIKGTENEYSGIKISILDDKNNYIVKNVNIAVNNKNWSYSFYVNDEINDKKTYKIIAQDFGYNELTYYYNINKVDNKAPTPTSGTTTSTTWSTSKNMTFTANDVGSGNVQIAFNNTKNYMSTTKNNTSYSKTYTFIGDVYGSTKAAVYYKDALGNETTQFVTISNIDNTKPTITKVESSKALGSTSLTITANDINTTLNKSGSGVSKYIITSSNSTPSEDDANWQTSNILKVTTPGTYYIFAKDLVGNISNAYEVKNVKVDYTLSVNPNGGSWNNSSTTQDFTITNGDTKTIANPSKVGYTFKNWTLSGTNAKFENFIFTMGNANASLVANWNINQYNVTYIDVVDSTNGTQLGKTTKKVNYNSNVRGSDIGSSTSDNAYYNGYYYSSDTSATVTTSGATVYRIFKLRTIDKTSNLTWNDNNNKNGFRPSKYTLKLMRNGSVFKQVELTSSQTSYTFSNLTKYDSKGNAFKYTFQVDASDRYKITLDSNGNTITENYQNSTFSVTIPKTISLNGFTGKGNYNVKVNGTFYYNDTLTVTPNSSFALKDRSGVSTLQANVTQNVNTFTKDNLGTTSGSISLNKIKFAGKFNGTFNFNIKFVMKN